MIDIEITANEVHRIDEPREHTIYMEMFGMRRSYQNNMGQMRCMLLETLLRTGKSLNAQSVKVNGIYANGFTPKGAALCRALGLQPIVASAQSGDIFFGQLFGGAPCGRTPSCESKNPFASADNLTPKRFDFNRFEVIRIGRCS